MAEESGGASWWSSWDKVFDSVKEKSTNVYELVAKDLQEFVSTIQTDTTEVIAETAHVVKEKLEVDESDNNLGTANLVKQGVSTWLGNVSTSLKEGITKVSSASIQSPSQSQSSSIFDRAKARVEHMQTDPATYCNEPNGPVDLYNDWCKTFHLEDHKGEISDLLVNNSKVRALYTNLVPVAVTHSLFWHRYFYKLHQFTEEDKRKAGIMARANQLDEEDLGWGDDDDDDLWENEDKLTIGLPKVQQPSLVKSAHEQIIDRDDLEFVAEKSKQTSEIDKFDTKARKLPENDASESQGDEKNVEILEERESDSQPSAAAMVVESSKENLCQETDSEPIDAAKMVESSKEHLCQKSDSKPIDAAKMVESSKENLCQDSSSENVPAAVCKDVDADKIIETKTMSETLDNLKLETNNLVTVKEEHTQEGKQAKGDDQSGNVVDKIKSVLSSSEENSQSDDSGSFVKVPGNRLEQQISKSDISDDGSWAKLSDEDLPKDETRIKELNKEFQRGGTALSPGSSSMSSPVLVADVADKEKDLEEANDDLWDEDFDLDEDISDDEVQRIVDAMKNKDPSQIAEDDDWEDWE